MPKLSALLAALVLLSTSAQIASAAESAVVTTRNDSASLLSASDSFVAGRTLWLGLRLRLASGWHTYWSNPGDAGEAPTVAITVSGGCRGEC